MSTKKGVFIDFSKVKAAVNIEAVLEQYDLLGTMSEKETANGTVQLVGQNPLQEGSSKTALKINLEDQSWTIFYGRDDHESGNVLDLVCHLEDDLDPYDRKDLRNAAMRLMEWFEIDGRGNPIKKGSARRTSSKSARSTKKSSFQEPVKRRVKSNDKPDDAATSPRTQGNKPTSNKPYGRRLKDLDREHPQMQTLGILPDTADHFDIGFRDKGYFASHIVFAMMDHSGETVMCYAGCPTDESTDSEGKGAPELLWPKNWQSGGQIYNLANALVDAPLQASTIKLVGDPITVWKAFENGIGNYCAVLENRLSDTQADVLIDATRHFEKVPCLLINAPDLKVPSALVAKLAENFLLHIEP